MNADAASFSFSRRQAARVFVLAFLFARLISLIALPLEGLRGYGDFLHYFLMNRLEGLPFFNYWVEYPPVFPFISWLLYGIAGEREHVFTYLLFCVLTAADAGSLALFWRIANHFHPAGQAVWRTLVFLLALVALPYSWWYFDPLVVFCALLGISLLLDRRWISAAGVIGLGVALKLFPFLVLLAAWKRISWKRFALLVGLSLAPVALLYGALWLASPEFTGASLRAQASKGSWETVWALLDGNIRTGSFGDSSERLDPAAAASRGNPAVIPPLVSLVLFGGIGLAGLWKARIEEERSPVALVGFAWVLFVLWSPGWSPQWVLYLLPLVLLTLPGRQAILFGAALVLINLLEWPVLLSRGYFSYLWVPIIIRTLIMLILCAVWGEMILFGAGGSPSARLSPPQ